MELCQEAPKTSHSEAPPLDAVARRGRVAVFRPKCPHDKGVGHWVEKQLGSVGGGKGGASGWLDCRRLLTKCSCDCSASSPNLLCAGASSRRSLVRRWAC